MTPRIAITNVVIGGGWYPLGQERLRASCAKHAPEADLQFWNESYPPLSPTHKESHKQFKLWAMVNARNMGYDIAIWADASVWFVKGISSLVERTERDGYWYMKDGHLLGVWTTDTQLEILEYTRDQAMKVFLVMGALWAIDFRRKSGKAIIDYLIGHRSAFGNASEESGLVYDGEFKGSKDPLVRGHRHDNCVLGAAADRLGLPPDSAPTFLTVKTSEVPPSAIAIARGM